VATEIYGSLRAHGGTDAGGKNCSKPVIHS
jgi:hypothetical protein